MSSPLKKRGPSGEDQKKWSNFRGRQTSWEEEGGNCSTKEIPFFRRGRRETRGGNLLLEKSLPRLIVTGSPGGGSTPREKKRKRSSGKGET